MLETTKNVYVLNQHDARKLLVYVPDCIHHKPYIWFVVYVDNQYVVVKWTTLQRSTGTPAIVDVPDLYSNPCVTYDDRLC